jgi:hypothetical protein
MRAARKIADNYCEPYYSEEQSGQLELATHIDRESGLAELIRLGTAAPDLPDDWPSEDAIEAYAEAYKPWRARLDKALARVRGE